MTLQQLKYIIAIDRHRSFARAADELGVTQPTLSSLLQKLENELDVRIFDRSNKSVCPTAIGLKILRQAETAVNEAGRINEIVAEEKGSVAGELRMSVGPTIAPYILPKFIKTYTKKFPQVVLSIDELKSDAMTDALYRAYSKFRYTPSRSGCISPKAVGANCRCSGRIISNTNKCG